MIFSASKRGKPMLKLEDYICILHRISVDPNIFRCKNRTCKGRVCLKLCIIMLKTTPHTHPLQKPGDVVVHLN